jgi:hypothetical protein
MSQFSHDVFISYAHQANKDGWVDAFHDELINQLSDLMPREPIIWRDAQLSDGDVFPKEIEDRVRSTKVMVSVLTPRYFTSDWCLRELSIFHQAAENDLGVTVQNKSRIIKALKVRVTPKEPRNEFADTTGFHFYVKDDQSLEEKKFVHKKTHHDYHQFEEQVVRVATHIAAVVNAIDEQVGSPEPASKPVVFLAETVAELERDRKRVRDELTVRHYEVVPPENERMPFVLTPYRAKIKKYLAQAQFSIHLIGNNYGMVPEFPEGEEEKEKEKSIVELQNQWAEERRGKNNFESLIWIPEHVTGADEKQRTFLEYLSKNPNAQRHAEPSRMSFESFKQKVVDRLQKVEERITASLLPARSIKTVYLMGDKRDRESVIQLKKFLFSCGYEVFVPPSLTGGGQATKSHRKYLKSCDATLIYYGDTSERWVSDMILDLINEQKLRERGDFLCKVLFLAGSDKEFDTRAAEVLKHDGISVQSSLMPFISCLEGKANRKGEARHESN